MKFRPCIDVHEGKVKQIVGETLDEDRCKVKENFVSQKDSKYYASLFKQKGLQGGHVIMLGKGNEQAAVEALQAYPNGLQIGGGINDENATFFLEKGASHVIVTSFIFQDGHLHIDNLKKIVDKVGKKRLVIDLSCKARAGKWYVVTNRWKTFSDFELNPTNIAFLENYCDEFLIHAVDVEGKRTGIQESLVKQLTEWVSIPTTYAGGASSFADIDLFKQLTNGNLDITIGSALDIFGGDLPFDEVVTYMNQLK